MAAELWQWITPDGDTFRLDSFLEGAQIIGDVDGRLMPPIRRTTEVVPQHPGSRLRSVVHDENETSLGVLFSGTTATELRQTVRDWSTRLDPANGEGKLRVTGPAGDVRELSCSYLDGLRAPEPAGMRLDQPTVLTFVAADPYWADPEDSTESWTYTAGGGIFPFFPLRLTASQVFGVKTITNSGDVPTFPRWIVTGPGEQLVLENRLTGRRLVWDGTLGAGEFIVIDCRDGNQSETPKAVIGNDGSDRFGELSTYDFWPLEKGAQDVSVEWGGAGVGSQVVQFWQSRYLGV